MADATEISLMSMQILGEGRNFSLTGKIITTDETNKVEVNICNDRVVSKES